MKVTYQTQNGKLKVELEGDSQRDIFGEISKFQEVFEEDTCGKCGSGNIKFVVRNVDENLYYELRCADCGAKLSFVNVYSTTKKLKRIYAVNLYVSLTKNTHAEVAKERN